MAPQPTAAMGACPPNRRSRLLLMGASSQNPRSRLLRGTVSASDPLDRVASALAEATAEQAREPAEVEAEYLWFRIQGEHFALRSSYVTAVIRPGVVTELPGAPAHVVGVCSYLGRPLAIVDLAVMAGGPRVEQARRLLVVDAEGLVAAIPVSEVVGIGAVAASAVEPAPRGASPYVTGRALRRDQPSAVVDAGRLLSLARVRGGSS
jgi:purine-binding chemotaxis protein CheW